jgi:ankyrin repeat protein
MMAVLSDNPSAFALYLSRFPESVDLRNKQGETALILAARRGHDDYIEKLIDHGADINACDQDGCTALHYAAAYGHVDTISVLVDHGCRFAVQNKRGWTALDWSYSTAVAQHLQDTARIAYEGKKLLQKRMSKRTRRQLLSSEE